jgi:hypothetical protein
MKLIPSVLRADSVFVKSKKRTEVLRDMVDLRNKVDTDREIIKALE